MVNAQSVSVTIKLLGSTSQPGGRAQPGDRPGPVMADGSDPAGWGGARLAAAGRGQPEHQEHRFVYLSGCAPPRFAFCFPPYDAFYTFPDSLL